jgi:hypothetical protein
MKDNLQGIHSSMKNFPVSLSVEISAGLIGEDQFADHE